MVCIRILGHYMQDLDAISQIRKDNGHTSLAKVLLSRNWRHLRPLLPQKVCNKNRTKAAAHLCEEAGFIACFGAVDVMKIHWKSCRSWHKGRYHNENNRKCFTIIVEK